MTPPQSPSSFTPILKRVVVRASQERAFRRFTTELATWWPLASHSVGQQDAESVVMEERVGGRIVESIRDGRRSVWGTITAWEPPHRVAFTWHPGREPETAQDVEVRFTADGDRTRVELEHRGFERLGAELGRKARRGYPIGWTHVLGIYAERRGPVMLLLHGLTAVLVARHRRRRRREAGTSSPQAG